MELSFLYELQQLHNPILDAIMVFITGLGDKGMIWIVIALLLCCQRKSRACGVSMLIAMLMGLVLGNGIVKNLIARPRPCWIDPSVSLLIVKPTDYSFPSGHTLASVEGAVTIWLYNRKWGIPALILAGFIAFSRLYLFVHYPTDVLVGVMLGVIIAVTVYNLVYHLYNIQKN